MKQTFVVEFTHAPSLDRVSDLMLWNAIWEGLNPLKNNLPSSFSVQEIDVEQNHGTPENVNQKAFDLLKRAAQSLNDYSDYTGGGMKDSLGEEIEDYIRENTKE